MSSLDQLLVGLDVSDLTTYLGASGWKRRSNFPRRELLVFDAPNTDDAGDTIEAVIPSERSRDFLQRAIELIHSLAELENRSAEEIVTDMLTPNADRIKLRVVSQISEPGSVPLSFASQLVNSVRDLFVAAACTEEHPRPFFTKATSRGASLANSCRFGQTQPGSFIVNIECPLTPTLDQADPAPFERRVTARVMRGLAEVQSAVLNGRLEDLRNSYVHGLNANMCEALLALRDSTEELMLEARANWSRRLRAPSDVASEVRIESHGFEFIRATANTLRAPRPSSIETLVGPITKLSAAPEADSDEEDAVDSEDRHITVRFKKHGKQHARVHLDTNSYRAACDAHRDGLEVSVTGRLERIGEYWHMLSPSNFQVLAPS